MGRTVKIPTWKNPYEVRINNTIYSYKAGAEAYVPDEVAEIIQRDIEEHTKMYATPIQPRWGKLVITDGVKKEISKTISFGYGTGTMGTHMTPSEYNSMMASTDFVGKAYINDENFMLTKVVDVTKEQFAYNESNQLLVARDVPWNAADCGEYATISFSAVMVEYETEKVPAEFLAQDDALRKMAEAAYEATAIDLSSSGETHQVGGVTFCKLSNEVKPASLYRNGAVTLYYDGDVGAIYCKSQEIIERSGLYFLCGDSNLSYPTVVMVDDRGSGWNDYEFPSNGVWGNIGDMGGTAIKVLPYAGPNYTYSTVCANCANYAEVAVGELGTTVVPCCSNCK